ncbi:hypothetical protein PAPYR_3711 [Paratrimastix pyriformis]|uniref:OTU domain-containing protein n=1 Tax=Paratrimastix pyriformis TaxID=342808 RepID=A0ABQ8ULB9_9EUKA|nr:hypothetical protein PAPYR_3711 [Paratrimastix pyriformis]
MTEFVAPACVLNLWGDTEFMRLLCTTRFEKATPRSLVALPPSPDGRARVFMGSMDARDAEVHEIDSAFALVRTAVCQGHTGYIYNVDYCPPSEMFPEGLLLTASGDKTARLWTPSGLHLATLDVTAVCSAVRMLPLQGPSPAVTFFVTTSWDGAIRIFKVLRREPTGNSPGDTTTPFVAHLVGVIADADAQVNALYTLVAIPNGAGRALVVAGTQRGTLVVSEFQIGSIEGGRVFECREYPGAYPLYDPPGTFMLYSPRGSVPVHGAPIRGMVLLPRLAGDTAPLLASCGNDCSIRVTRLEIDGIPPLVRAHPVAAFATTSFQFGLAAFPAEFTPVTAPQPHCLLGAVGLDGAARVLALMATMAPLECCGQSDEIAPYVLAEAARLPHPADGSQTLAILPLPALPPAPATDQATVPPPPSTNPNYASFVHQWARGMPPFLLAVGSTRRLSCWCSAPCANSPGLADLEAETAAAHSTIAAMPTEDKYPEPRSVIAPADPCPVPPGRPGALTPDQRPQLQYDGRRWRVSGWMFPLPADAPATHAAQLRPTQLPDQLSGTVPEDFFDPVKPLDIHSSGADHRAGCLYCTAFHELNEALKQGPPVNRYANPDWTGLLRAVRAALVAIARAHPDLDMVPAGPEVSEALHVVPGGESQSRDPIATSLLPLGPLRPTGVPPPDPTGPPAGFDLPYHVPFILGDGNCLCRSVAMALWGSQDPWVRVRWWLVVELAHHAEWYAEQLRDRRPDLLPAEGLAGPDPWNPTMREEMVGCLQEATRKGSFLGVLHVAALSNVLRRPLVMLCPALPTAPEQLWALFEPLRHQSGPLGGVPLAVTWTAFGVKGALRTQGEVDEAVRHLSAGQLDHFVPLIPVRNRPGAGEAQPDQKDDISAAQEQLMTLGLRVPRFWELHQPTAPSAEGAGLRTDRSLLALAL